MPELINKLTMFFIEFNHFHFKFHHKMFSFHIMNQPGTMEKFIFKAGEKILGAKLPLLHFLRSQREQTIPTTVEEYEGERMHSRRKVAIFL